MNYLYVDIKTTGLIPGVHDVWEIAFAVDDGPIRHGMVGHDLRISDPEALRIGGHTDRFDFSLIDEEVEAEFIDAALQRTVVGASPQFDLAFLGRRFLGPGEATPWLRRPICVSTVAAHCIGWETPRSLAETCEHLGLRPGRHTAYGDVQAARDVHRHCLAWADRARDALATGARS
jgi:DNA polymerase III epsilon subunit-like protein